MTAPPDSGDAAADYCRAVEAHLCRRNAGHLVRIVGPAFEQVCSWAVRGVPLTVVCGAIDRVVERQAAKGTRRRPIRIEFCEGDVLDLFDEWRRATGIPLSSPPGASDASSDAQTGRARRTDSLPAHLDRTIARLTALRGGGDLSFDRCVEDTVRAIDAMRASVSGLRGQSRQAVLAQLRALDETLVASALRLLDDATRESLLGEAEQELAPFRGRLDGAAWRQALAASMARLLRAHARLPVVAYDAL